MVRLETIVGLWDLSRRESRRAAVLVLLLAALLSPEWELPGGLPAVRAEQVLLAALLPSLALAWRRDPLERRLGPLDWAFLALAAAMTVTIIVAPFFVSRVSRSPRDVFEVARVVEYWLMYRVALRAFPAGETATGVLIAGGLAAMGAGVFSLAQYLAPERWNEAVTGIWAPDHHLRALVRQGRVVGTVGNANYFGMVAGLWMLQALALIALRERLAGRWRWLPYGAAGLATLSLVMSQSRTAVVAMLGALFLGWLVLALRRGLRPAYAAAGGTLLLAAAASITFVEVVPPDHGSFHQRFSPSAFGDDASLTIRISKWRSLFAGLFGGGSNFCDGPALHELEVAEGQEAREFEGIGPGPAEAVARDEQRVADIQAIAGALVGYFCDVGRWPVNVTLGEALVPQYLAAIPTDPGTGEAYPIYLSNGGFTAGAGLEDRANRLWPAYTLGTIPNMVLNPSFEDGSGTPSHWSTASEARASRDGREARYGDRSVEVELGPGGSLYHLVVFEFAPDANYTVHAWARSANGQDQSIGLHLVATRSDGQVNDPLEVEGAVLPAEGSWVPISLTFRTPGLPRISVLQVLFLAPNGPVVANIDGVQVAEGTVAPQLENVRTVDPATLRPRGLARFADSPLIGVGPQKDATPGAYDNEYALFLQRYGVVGTVAYLAIWAFAVWTAWRAWLVGTGPTRALALSALVFTFAMLAFNVTAGSFYSFQVMAIYWLLIGVLGAALREGEEAR